jgi:predicted secreted protein
LTIQLRAEVTGPDATRVQSEINRRMAAALERARAVPTVRAETRGYWVNQERPHNTPVRWRGQQMLALIGGDAAATLALAGELQQSGLVMSGMNFDLLPETARAAEDELTAEALKRLRERAARVAAAMALNIRNIRDVRVGQVGGQIPPRPMMMRADAAGSVAQPVAEAGETTVRVTVDAEVVLVPRP